jgi:UDP-N-acetylmuramate dehydrogenase
MSQEQQHHSGGIPGTVGGALYMNAGAYGSEMKDVVLRCVYINPDGELCTLERSELELSYRHSVFSGNGGIIVSVTLALSAGNSEEIQGKMEELLNRRKLKQPLEYPSAGSTFKRPEGSYASLLIDECGLKGLHIGGAQVSEKHAGFIVNKGGATCRDVLELCRQVQDTVKEKTGFTLELEPIVLK